MSEPIPVRSFVITARGQGHAASMPHSGPALTVLSDAITGLDLVLELHDAADAMIVRGRLSSGRDGGLVRLLVGDASESNGFNLGIAYTNLVQIEIDLTRERVELQSSLVGLPPVFRLQAGSRFALTTPLPPAPQLGIELGGLDLGACADLLRWGHPIDGRTMANNVKVIAAGSRVTVSAADGVGVVERPFDFPASAAQVPRDDLISSLCDEFAANARRLDARGAIVSLSGGLDSRAAAVAMLNAGHQLSFVTLATNDRSLDAQLARAFCQSYGAKHRVVYLDERFVADLPARLGRTAALTYGVSVLNQSVDMFMYEELGATVERRVTGNLGNQVGRGGVESTAAYRPTTESLSAPLRRELDARGISPWYLERMNGRGFAHVLFQQEVSYWSIPNYSVGARYAIQQCPYASRRLVELATALFALNPQLANLTLEALRARDLTHRMRGTPREWSFQRRYLIDADRKGRDVPINWGWLARGGWSPRWVWASLQAMTDAAAVKWSSGSSWQRGVAGAIPAAMRRPYALIRWPELVRGPLREYVNDTVRSAVAAQSGAFDASALHAMLDGHFSGTKPAHESVVRALEIASACHAIRA